MGIVDYATVARRYAELLTEMGADIILGETVIDVQQQGKEIEVIGTNRAWRG